MILTAHALRSSEFSLTTNGATLLAAVYVRRANNARVVYRMKAIISALAMMSLAPIVACSNPSSGGADAMDVFTAIDVQEDRRTTMDRPTFTDMVDAMDSPDPTDLSVSSDAPALTDAINPSDLVDSPDAVVACDAQMANCRGGCVDPQTDAMNCGMCGVRCVAGQLCVAGMCVRSPSEYTPVGPQTNVPVAMVTAGGWTECYRDLFNNGMTSLATLQEQCNLSEVMVSCRATGSATLQLLAQAARWDVFFDTGDNNNVLHFASGTNWYYSTGWSMGFAGPMDTVSRIACDLSAPDDVQRLCFHTRAGNIQGGYRCGADTRLNASAAFERVYYHRNLYRPVGPQAGVPESIVVNGGWTECYRDTYGNQRTPTLASIQAQCRGANIMLACRATGSPTLQVLAQARREDVFFDVGDGVDAVHAANGTNWYFSNDASMGFTEAGTRVFRLTCDPSMENRTTRLCWHTGGGNINPGWRCGANISLDDSGAYERVIYESGSP